jgi:hypothetical protein
VVGLSVLGLLVLWIGLHRPRPVTKPAPSVAIERPGSDPAMIRTTPTSGAVIAGCVREIGGGERGIQAHVCAADTESIAIGRPQTICVSADMAGRYTLPLAGGKAYEISAEAPSFQPGLAMGGRPIALSSGERRSGVDIVLAPGGSKLSGVVLDLTGGPVAGAVVRATRFVPPKMTVATLSDQAGRFVLWTVPGHVALNTQATGYAPSLIGREAPSTQVVITLTPGASIQGRVVSATDHKGIPNVDVRAAPLQRGSSPLNRSGTSDSTGAFRIDGIEPGAYMLAAEGAGWLGGGAGALRLGLGETITDVVVTVSKAVGVTGRVLVQPENSPCKAGTVVLGPPGRVTNDDPPSVTSSSDPAAQPSVPAMLTAIESDGVVHFRALPPGVYHPIVRCTDHVLRDGPNLVQVGETDVEGLVWNVEIGIGLVIHMVDENERPLPGARVWFRSASRHLNTLLAAGLDGQYEYPSVLFPGTYLLVPGGDGYAADPVTVELRSGAGKVDATVRFKGQGSILVHVQEKDGTPIDDVRVRASVVGGEESAAGAMFTTTAPVPATTTDDEVSPEIKQAPRPRYYMGVPLGDGSFRLGPLPLGRYVVQASDGVNPYFEGQKPGGVVEVVGGVATETIVVERTGSIRGVLVDPSNQPMADVLGSRNLRKESRIPRGRCACTEEDLKRKTDDERHRGALHNPVPGRQSRVLRPCRAAVWNGRSQEWCDDGR